MKAINLSNKIFYHSGNTKFYLFQKHSKINLDCSACRNGTLCFNEFSLYDGLDTKWNDLSSCSCCTVRRSNFGLIFIHYSIGCCIVYIRLRYEYSICHDKVCCTLISWCINWENTFVHRLCFVSGREGHFLEPMSYVHVRRSTPVPAVALSVRIIPFWNYLLWQC